MGEEEDVSEDQHSHEEEAAVSDSEEEEFDLANDNRPAGMCACQKLSRRHAEVYLCNLCDKFVHKVCSGHKSPAYWENLAAGKFKFFCKPCTQILTNDLPEDYKNQNAPLEDFFQESGSALIP